MLRAERDKGEGGGFDDNGKARKATSGRTEKRTGGGESFAS